MNTLIQTFDFPTYGQEIDPKKKYPYLNGQRYNFRMVIDSVVYIGTVTYNIWEGCPQLSITTDGETPIIMNIIMRPKITNNAPNLIPSLVFKNYRLLWDLKKGIQLYKVN